MNICVDARPLIKEKSGIGIYLRSMLNEILKIDKGNKYYLISDSEIFFDNHNKNVRKLIYPKSRLIPSTFLFEFYMGRYLKQKGITPDVFWGTQQFMPLFLPKECNSILTVHDLAYKVYPDTVDNKVLVMLKLFAKASIAKSKYVVCVSNYTKKTVKKFYGSVLRKKSVHVIYESSDIDNITCESEELPEQLVGKKFLLFIGIIEPRKNINVLLDAFENSEAAKDINLVICGKQGWKSEQTVKRMNKMKNVHYLNYVSDGLKRSLLEKSLAFVMPSKYEGFGIPVVEAMKLGTIVIAADNSSLTEIVGCKELLYKTYDSEQLTKIIDRLYSDEKYAEDKRKRCISRGEEFSWEVAAKEWLSIIYE